MLLFLSCLLLSLSACSTVKPWDKETLGEPTMQWKQEASSQPFVDHAQITVEQAEGGWGGAGGGCGCR